MRGSEEGRRGIIYKNGEISRRNTAQAPIHPHKRYPNLNKNKSDKIPIESIEILCQIKLEDKGTPIFCFDSMEDLLCNG